MASRSHAEDEESVGRGVVSPQVIGALPALDGLEGLSEEEMAAMRAEAQGRFTAGDTSLITVAVDSMDAGRGRVGHRRMDRLVQPPPTSR